ncbi:MAG: c-type cytochrome [Bacteroidetes bacterium]|nr:c-type cytochrome [Bacteroidota bacterium]
MQFSLKKFLLTLTLLGASFAVFAADTATSPKAAATQDSPFNPVLIGLSVVILLLLFAIVVLGNVVRQLALVYRDRLRLQKSKTVAKSILLLLIAILPTLNALAQDAAVASDSTAAKVPVSPFIAGIVRTDFYFLMGILTFELVIVFALLLTMRTLLRLISGDAEKRAAAYSVIKKLSFWERINGVVPMDKEQDIMLDHDYDGIQELDNSLPPWWKYGFYFTIFVAIAYLWYYHGGGNGPSSHDEYVAAMQKGDEEKAAYLAKTSGNIDENTVKMADATGIEEGKGLFAKNCAACHAADGGGIVGPNLTDEYWLHGGSIQDVFKSIKYGWQDKGMKSWKDDFSPKQIEDLASYVKSLHGTKPAAPKEKQGDLYVEGQAAPTTDAPKPVAAQ